MSNDLISRSAVIDVIKRHECNTIRIMEGVMKLPAAYNVDKVVEQMEQDSQNIELIYPTDQGYDYEDAIGIDINKAKQIVKSGGIE